MFENNAKESWNILNFCVKVVEMIIIEVVWEPWVFFWRSLSFK